jgi:hypothetical protein
MAITIIALEDGENSLSFFSLLRAEGLEFGVSRLRWPVADVSFGFSPPPWLFDLQDFSSLISKRLLRLHQASI